MQAMRGIPGLLAGFILFDVLLNLPGLSTAAPIASLVIPSIDLLVVGALCVGIAQARESSRLGLRIAASLLVLVLLVYAAGSRLGLSAAFHLFGDSGLRVALSSIATLAVVAGAAAMSFFLSGLLVRGFATTLVSSVFVLAIALCAVLQVLAGRHVFAPSIVPRIISDIAAHLR
jgi:hypothetical protein